MADRDKSDHLSFYYQRSGGPWNFFEGSHGFQENGEGLCQSQTDLKRHRKKIECLFFSHSPPFPSLEHRHACYISQIGVNHSAKSIGRMRERCM